MWIPGSAGTDASEKEPTFAELATVWLADRERNPAIRSRTTEDDRWRLTRYLIPFFGDLRPSQITPLTLKDYRRRLHKENEHIGSAEGWGPFAGSAVGAATSHAGQRIDQQDTSNPGRNPRRAEDAGWITRNAARGRRMREPVERRVADVLDADELLALLEAADQLDRQKHRPNTLLRAREVRALRDEQYLAWTEIATRIAAAPSTVIYLYRCEEERETLTGPRRAVIATLGFAGLRVSELCALDKQHVDRRKRKIYVRDSKTPAGVRVVDIRPRLLEELMSFPGLADDVAMDKPAYPTSTGSRRDRNNVNARLIASVLRHANALRAARHEPPIRAHVTPHTFRRTYITIMLAAGFDLPYVQDQVAHLDPSTTLAIYAKVIRRPDRDAVRAEMRALLGEDCPA